MGWTTCYTAKHYKLVKGRQVVDRKACVDDLYTWDIKDTGGTVIRTNRVIKSSLVGSVWYGAVKTEDKETGNSHVWAGVCLTCGKSKDGTIWGYKEMEETMGPNAAKCPLSIIDLLSPTTDSNALRWRESCRLNARTKTLVTTFELPTGVTCTYRGGWVLSSPEYRSRYAYSGVRYHRSVPKLSAIGQFIETYGTHEQKTVWNRQRSAA